MMQTLQKKYIFILAEDGDATVDEVMAWLDYQGRYEVARINHTDRIRFIHLAIGNALPDFEICINGELTVKMSKVHAYWYRRGKLNYQGIHAGNGISKPVAESINNYYSSEFEHSTDALHFLLRSHVPTCINAFNDIFTNKLINLECARQAGLLVPESIVSNDAAAVKAFLRKHAKCIVKPVRYPGGQAFCDGKDIFYSQTTHLITAEEADDFLNAHAVFQPTHFQEYIDKEFEIRTFILNENLFSMAIFSQQNEKTKIDFRNYDAETPNRTVPFQLPAAIEKQLIHCCSLIGTNCGSIDILYKNGNYYFLEINPVGQLQWLSHSCNYPVEKLIADTLNTAV